MVSQETRRKSKVNPLLGKPLDSHFFVMEMHENVLIIQRIHRLFGLLHLSNHYGAETEMGFSDYSKVGDDKSG